ncbi:hypothetical protein GGR54DRAFT_636444 [Hypoxylon sp. NC1633]|nr:hypothetical protein GGR54DRAFT_636444 [Hypoxylon sp. NC1633]
MSSTKENGELHALYVEELHGPDHLPEVAYRDHPPEVIEYKPAQDVAEAVSLPPRHNPFGLTPLAFGILVSLATALIVSAAIGGGLGAAVLANERNSPVPDTVQTCATKAPPAQTPTPTPLVDYVLPEPSLIQSLHVDCPALNDTLVQDELDAGARYRVRCGTSIVGQSETSVVASLAAYSFQDCLRACSLANQWAGAGAGVGSSACVAVTWCQAMSFCGLDRWNCWLRNATSPTVGESNYTTGILELHPRPRRDGGAAELPTPRPPRIVLNLASTPLSGSFTSPLAAPEGRERKRTAVAPDNGAIPFPFAGNVGDRPDSLLSLISSQLQEEETQRLARRAVFTRVAMALDSALNEFGNDPHRQWADKVRAAVLC